MRLQRLIAEIKSRLKGKLLQNILLVGCITFLVKLTGFYKETLVAAYFGLSELLDTYYIAILIPTFIQNVFIVALKTLFIPNYIIEQKTTKQLGAFQSLTTLSILSMIGILVLASLIFTWFFLDLAFPGHSASYYNLIEGQIYLALPCLLFWGFSSYLSGLLEIEGQFLLSNLSQLFTPLTTILFLFFLIPQFGDFTLVLGLLCGSIIGFLYLLFWNLQKRLIIFSPIKINSNMRLMIQQYTPKVTSGLLTGINPFVDQLFAAQLVVGSIAAINYGIKIPAFIISIVIIALGNVLLPHFSRVINEDLNVAFVQLRKILIYTFLGSLAFTLITMVFSSEIIALLFERNEFTADDTIIVSKIQQICLLHVPFYLCTLVTVYFLTALNKNKFMAWVSFLNLILNLILNFLFVKAFDVYGLVLSTTVVYILASLIYIGFAQKLKRNSLNSSIKSY